MSGLLWLICEMLLLLILAAVVFFSLGWHWQAKRARTQRRLLEERLDEEAQAAKVAREQRDAAQRSAPAPINADPEIAALAAELSETQAHQLSLERELLRLRDAKLALEQELKAVHAAPPPADDLTRLRGVGAVMSKKLHTAGITSYRQLASLTAADLSILDQTLKLQGRATREKWQDQARSLHHEVHGSPL
jgi:predicted flap endonuclease-1-like 5' DNA nuclease